jgi:hypothetical protein
MLDGPDATSEGARLELNYGNVKMQITEIVKLKSG